MLFSAGMAVASEAPASFRSSAIRPGALALIATGFLELLSRRRLIRYPCGTLPSDRAEALFATGGLRAEAIFPAPRSMPGQAGALRC